MLFLQEGEHSLTQVQTKGREPLHLGDWVEAVGFPDRGQYTPVLQDAVYHGVRSGQPVTAAAVTPDEVLKGSRDFCLVRLRARLLDRGESGGEKYLLLQENGVIFNAYLPQFNGHDPFAEAAKGSSRRGCWSLSD